MPPLFSAHGGVNLTIGCKMKYHLCFLFLFCVLASHAQTITITGKIIDKESKEGLPFASIGIKGVSLGTISNLSGEFDFHIPVRHRNDILVISMLGYQQFEAPVFSLQKEQLVIEMEKSNFLLKEVVVADTLQGGEIMEIALSKINQNY
ncbi:MAG: carboxypeptidase-like regulatory domain-containing protein, partial [Bacteroidota bacterium]